MELMHVVRDRRAVREYTDASVDRATIERLIGAATLAPSAMNLQPWAFAVILDRERIEKYGRRAKDWLLGNISQYPEAARRILEDPTFVLFYHAPALVILMAKSSHAEAPASQANEDCCLAAETFMLAARDEGLGTCWIGFARPWLNLPSTKLELGLPENCHVVAPIVLGYPKVWPESHGRNPAEIHWLG